MQSYRLFTRLSYIPIFLFITIFMLSCSGDKKEKVLAEQTLTFENSDWNFEDKFVYFDFDILESPQPYRIDMEIEHVPNLDLKDLNFVVSITAPSGAETLRRISSQTGIRNSDGTITTIVPYPEKYFNESGSYNFRIYRRYEKYNFYGIKSVTLKIVSLPLRTD